MSSSNPDKPTPTVRIDAEADGGRRTSLGQVLMKRVKDTFRKLGTSSKEVKSSAASIAGEGAIDTVMAGYGEENKPPAADEIFESSGIEVDNAEDTSEIEFSKMPSYYARNSPRRERMTSLLSKYGLSHDQSALEPARPPSPSSASRLRIEKNARMRVRTICHVCQFSFKGLRVCAKCGHSKCDECRRSTVSSRRSREQAAASQIDTDMISIESSADANMPEPGADNAEHRPRAVIERTKYICHLCECDFPSLFNTICCNCGHEKCERCSRAIIQLPSTYYEGTIPAANEPAKADRVYRPAKQRVRRHCHCCSALFVGKSMVCKDCLHERCKDCPRFPPRPKNRKSRSKQALSTRTTLTFDTSMTSLPISQQEPVEGPVAGPSTGPSAVHNAQ